MVSSPRYEERCKWLTLCRQVINVYRQIMPQFDQFISTMDPHDQTALKANYEIPA